MSINGKILNIWDFKQRKPYLQNGIAIVQMRYNENFNRSLKLKPYSVLIINSK